MHITESSRDALNTGSQGSLSYDPYALIDIHLHLDGSLSVANTRQLIALCEPGSASADAVAHLHQINDSRLVELLSVDEGCTDLNEYLSKFDLPARLLQTKVQLTLAAETLLHELSELGLAYAELRFAPQRHTWDGLTQAEAIEAVIEGMAAAPIPASLILCCMRGDDNHAENTETLELACAHLEHGVAALDLAGAEALFPTRDFTDIFAEAAKRGLPYTIHAGEAAGPESVWEALEMGAQRIGHGVRSIEDPDLVRELASRGTVLELCPTSNLNTSVYSDLGNYPVREFLEAGVRVCVNADNIAVSRTHVGRELRLVKDVLSLSDEDVRILVMNAIEASYADNDTKAELKTLVNNRLP